MPLSNALSAWHDFYSLFGSASATLIGLLFVAASVGTGVYHKDRHIALRSFLSPSVVHLGSILAVCLSAMIPTGSWTLFGALIEADGLFGLLYAAGVWRNMARHHLLAKVDLEDRVYYAVLPSIGHAVTVGAGIVLMLRHPAGCGVLAVALAMLMLISIRNAWDMTLWTVMSQGRREAASAKPVEETDEIGVP